MTLSNMISIIKLAKTNAEAKQPDEAADEDWTDADLSCLLESCLLSAAKVVVAPAVNM